MNIVCFKILNTNLNEYIPLKQGLRPSRDALRMSSAYLNEYIPLKQGLRRLSVAILDKSYEPSMSIFH